MFSALGASEVIMMVLMLVVTAAMAFVVVRLATRANGGRGDVRHRTGGDDDPPAGPREP